MIAAIIIAGGKARRFEGADKAMIIFNGKPLINHVIERISPQVGLIALNRPSPLNTYNFTNVPDLDDERCGPIGGLEAAIVWAHGLKDIPEYLLSIPVDTPFLPLNLVSKLLPAAKQYGAAIAQSSNQAQPTVSLHKLGHISQQDIQSYKHKRFRDFWDHVGAQRINFNNEKDFININCPEDVKLYENENIK